MDTKAELQVWWYRIWTNQAPNEKQLKTHSLLYLGNSNATFHPLRVKNVA